MPDLDGTWLLLSMNTSENPMNLSRIPRHLGVMASVVTACLVSSEVKAAPQAEVATLMSKDLPDFPGKEGTMIVVTYPPGNVDPVHRHDAHSFIYVLEGSIVLGLRGGKEVTLSPGQTFYEGPNDIHTVGRNASKDKPAKFVVVLIKDRGAPILVPAN
jgi:quercetin dioxygenase-like cupin family protein